MAAVYNDDRAAQEQKRLDKVASKKRHDGQRRLEAEQALAANLDYVFQLDVEFHRELTRDYLAACAFKLECIKVVEEARRRKKAFERGEAGVTGEDVQAAQRDADAPRKIRLMRQVLEIFYAGCINDKGKIISIIELAVDAFTLEEFKPYYMPQEECERTYSDFVRIFEEYVNLCPDENNRPV